MTADTNKLEKPSDGKQRVLYVVISILVVLQVVSLTWLLYFQLNLHSVALSTCQDVIPAAEVDPTLPADAPLLRVRRKTSKGKRNNNKGQRKTRSDKHNLAVTTTSPTSVLPQANVEFINPNFKDEFTSKSENDKENPWVWLNAYSRIPLFAIQEFCSATKDYCPAGPPGPIGKQGLIGERGLKGDRGERGPHGDVGPRGPVGPPGPMGPRGPKGEIGEPGLPGLDGRDGIPGEPGLDGIPGRNGQDGSPGSHGVPGLDGMPGLPGRDGVNGFPGAQGPKGDQGPAGPSGLTGPRGKNGRPGLPGLPGIPGINTWMVNGTDAKRLLIPPTVLGSEVNSSRPIVIKEGDNLRLRCAVAGIPRPEVSWTKADGSLIPMGSWKTSDIIGPALNITRIHRDHMGTYMCIADNGVPPPAYRTFHVEVHFAPLIRTHVAMVGAANGTSVLLECIVEAFPESLCYWEGPDGKIIENTEKRYSVFQRDFDSYKVQMTLNLTVTNEEDYGRYYCVSKNEIGITKGLITVYETDPHFATPPPTATGSKEDTVWGPAAPDLVDLEDVCPPPPECPRCPALPASKCRDSGLGLFDVLGRLDIRPLGNNTYPGFTNRTQDCVISAIGKPVYYRFSDSPYGSWMRDAAPRTPLDGEKYWATRFNDFHHLYEYYNKTSFRNDVFQKNYTLSFAFKGHLHVVYNGSFYYHQQDEPRIIRFELGSERTSSVSLPNATVTDNWYIYSQSQSYMDFAVDENGLWVIYGLQPNNNTAVAKLNPFTLDIEYIWNISLNNQRAGEMFITCGVLYAVDSVTEHSTKIRFALDLYKNKLVPEIELPFSNPFRKTTMVGYNPRTKELYTWDKGNQLSYPVKSVDAGYNVPDNDGVERIEIISAEASSLTADGDFDNY